MINNPIIDQINYKKYVLLNNICNPYQKIKHVVDKVTKHNNIGTLEKNLENGSNFRGRSVSQPRTRFVRDNSYLSQTQNFRIHKNNGNHFTSTSKCNNQKLFDEKRIELENFKQETGKKDMVEGKEAEINPQKYVEHFQELQGLKRLEKLANAGHLMKKMIKIKNRLNFSIDPIKNQKQYIDKYMNDLKQIQPNGVFKGKDENSGEEYDKLSIDRKLQLYKQQLSESNISQKMGSTNTIKSNKVSNKDTQKLVFASHSEIYQPIKLFQKVKRNDSIRVRDKKFSMMVQKNNNIQEI